MFLTFIFNVMLQFKSAILLFILFLFSVVLLFVCFSHVFLLMDYLDVIRILFSFIYVFEYVSV